MSDFGKLAGGSEENHEHVFNSQSVSCWLRVALRGVGKTVKASSGVP